MCLPYGCFVKYEVSFATGDVDKVVAKSRLGSYLADSFPMELSRDISRERALTSIIIITPAQKGFETMRLTRGCSSRDLNDVFLLQEKKEEKKVLSFGSCSIIP